jgi:flagellar biosynthetic protein FliR
VSTGFTTTHLVTFLLVLTRTGTWLWLTPPFGGRTMPALVRVMLSVALSVPLTPSALAASSSTPVGLPDIAAAVAVQAAVGAAMGLACLTLISAVQSAGTAIDIFGGFSLAQAFDPMLMQQSSVMARVYQLLAGVILLVSGAHMMLMQGFATTFEVLPVDGSMSLSATSETLTAAVTTFFVATLQIAGPLIGVMVLADFGMGLLSRVAPSLNAFSLGFPIKISLTLALVGLALPHLPSAVTGLSGQAVDAMRSIAGG